MGFHWGYFTVLIRILYFTPVLSIMMDPTNNMAPRDWRVDRFFFQVWFAAVEIRRSCPLEWHCWKVFLFKGVEEARKPFQKVGTHLETWHDIAPVN